MAADDEMIDEEDLGEEGFLEEGEDDIDLLDDEELDEDLDDELDDEFVLVDAPERDDVDDEFVSVDAPFDERDDFDDEPPEPFEVTVVAMTSVFGFVFELSAPVSSLR